MSPDTTKWRVEESDGEATRVLSIEALSWEGAVQSAWTTWALAHELKHAGVEVGLSATQIFIRGTALRYRVSPEAAPRKRIVPRPVISVPAPPLAKVPATSAQAPANPARAELPKAPARKVEAKPNGRALFGKLPRASSPDLEHEARKSRGSQPDSAEVKARAKSQPDFGSALAGIAVPTEQPARAPATPLPSAPDLPEPPQPLPSMPTEHPADAVVMVPIRVERASQAPPAARVDDRRMQMLVAGAVQLYAREQDPKNGAPVVYRQRGYALPMGTEEHEGEAFGLWMLQQLQQQIPASEAPRLFHLAVYDEMFTGDPPVLALCKLEWKEWKNETNVTFPRRGEDSVMDAPRMRTPSMHPPDLQSPPVPPPGNPAAASKAEGRVAALFLPPVTPPSFAVQAPPTLAGSTPNRGSEGDK